MTASWRVSEVQVVGDHAVRVRFRDGLEGTVRFESGFFRGVFKHLAEPSEFRRVTVANGAVTWPGELDLAPDAMHREIKARGEWIVEA